MEVTTVLVVVLAPLDHVSAGLQLELAEIEQLDIHWLLLRLFLVDERTGRFVKYFFFFRVFFLIFSLQRHVFLLG